MIGRSRTLPEGSPLSAPLAAIPRLALTVMPLALLQPVLDRVAVHVARTRPSLFARLGPHVSKRYMIDPIDLPVVFILVPDARKPHLKVHRRNDMPACDACIAGTFSSLMNMVDTSLDGDALFFTRELRVSGDVEAVVALRNALDDCDGSVLDSIASAFGPFSGPAGLALSTLRAMTGGRRIA
jgi:predicted lipid carrier protein YhbT